MLKKGLFFVISILFFISLTVYGPFLSLYASDLGVEPVVIGSIIGASGLASIFTRFGVGVLSDFMKKRRIFIQAGLVLVAIAYSIAFFAPSAVTLYLAKFLGGLTGATFVIYNVYYANMFSKEEAPRAVAILALTSPGGSFIGNLIGGAVAGRFGYSATFIVAVAAGALGFLLSLFLEEIPFEEKKYTVRDVKEQLTDKSLWLLSILSIITLIVPYATKDTQTPIILKELGAGTSTIAAFSNVHLVCNTIAIYLSGSWFKKKLGIVNTAVTGAVLLGVTAIIMPFLTNLTVFFLVQAIAGFGLGLNFTVLTSLTIYGIESSKQSTRMGMYQNLYSIGMFFGPTLIGILIATIGVKNGYIIVGALSLVGAIVTKLNLNQFSEAKI